MFSEKKGRREKNAKVYSLTISLKVLKEFSFYHGFLPREDLLFVLKNEGDYLLRISEVDSAEKTVTFVDFYRIDSPMSIASIVGAIVIRLLFHLQIKNIIIRRLSSKYFVEISKPFDTIKDLLTNDVVSCQYGEVREGTVRRKQQTLQVAIKLAKGTGDMSKAKIKEMMREARLIRNFKHRNIVRLYGVAVDEQPLYILLELVKGGSLNVYLKTHGEAVSTSERMSMCYGAAQGVEYIHKQSCIHMDLAARNCLYSEDKVVKISDFGLSRLGTQYTIRSSRKLPIKWLAPETISAFTFSLKTDVFSYGVMVYEIFTSGKEPWDGFTNTEVKKLVRCFGKMLTLPELCPEAFRKFIHERVFVKDPSNRASMTEVIFNSFTYLLEF
ncbi:unnamed protein product [Angiostrongylus costaricensis]|uniref:Tyrosine-protein kinase n=1 Tax=Angiostrongylus costaricensis TaxID=334426 RepID=A0A0R3PWH8_ANGCS|nr:unnamed protein product [Angiostrongylus costaricensis]